LFRLPPEVLGWLPPAEGEYIKSGAEKKKRDSSLRDPAHTDRAEEKAGSLRSE
jgi:hypothetical protein